MKQKSVGLTLRAAIFVLALILVAGSPALPPFDGVAYAQAAAPTNLTATEPPGGGSVSLNWDAVSGADSYEVWKGTGSGQTVAWGGTALETVSELTYSDTAVTTGSTYSYAVRAVGCSTAACFSVVSITLSGGTAAPTAKPTVTVTASGLTAINVTWPDVAGATSYHVQYWYDDLDNWMRVAGDQTSPYAHIGLTPGKRYFYVVRAVNAGGNGPWSDYASHTLTATDPEPVLSHTHVSRQVVQLSWSATSTTATYNLQRGKSTTAPVSDLSWSNVALSANDIANRSYTDNNAAYDTGTTMYHYRVQAVEDGTPGMWSNVEMVTIPSTGVRPVAPSDLTAGAGSNAVSSIRLAWTATAGTTSEIRWKSGSQAWSDPMVGTSPYNHTGRSALTQYTYQVRARNINGPSLWSDEVMHTTSAAPATSGQMPMVVGLTVTDESEDSDNDGTIEFKIKLTWNQVASATHYDIRRFPSGSGNTSAWASPADGNDLTSGRIAVDAEGLSSPTSPSWEDMDSNLSASTTYYYVVSAVNDNGAGPDDDEMGPWSAYESVTTIANSVGGTAPVDLAATVTGPTAIWLSWSAVGNATSYTIQWRVGSLSESPISATGTSHYLSGLNPNTEYLFRIRAENSSSMTPYSDPEETATTWLSGLQPPSNVKAEDASTRDDDGGNAAFIIKVSWNEATGATGYQLQKWDPSSISWVNVGTLTDRATTVEMSQDDTGLIAGTMYYYRVRTVSATDMSSWSPVVNARTDHARPTAPVLVATSTGMSMIRLSWGAVDNAMNYKLEVMEGIAGTADFDPDELEHSMMLSGNARHYVHSGLTAGTRYSYRLKAVLSEDVETVWSNIADRYTKPMMPQLTATAAGHDSMTLTWDAVPFVTDADPTVASYLRAITEYRIERRLAGTNTWDQVTIDSACIEATNKCMATDTSLSESSRYFYRIRATVPRGGVTYTSYWDYANQYTPAASN